MSKQINTNIYYTESSIGTELQFEEISFIDLLRCGDDIPVDGDVHEGPEPSIGQKMLNMTAQKGQHQIRAGLFDCKNEYIGFKTRDRDHEDDNDKGDELFPDFCHLVRI